MDMAGLCLQTTPAMLVCGKHGKYNGWIMQVGDREIQSACDKCVEDEARDQLRVISERIHLNQQRDMFNRSCIPPRFRDNKIESWIPPNDQAVMVKSTLMRFSAQFSKALQHGTSFLFTGGTGTGKTHIATAVANAVMLSGYSAIYISSLNYISAIKRAWNSQSGVSEDELIESYVGYDLCILDEMGKGTMSAAEKSMIFRLLDRRYEEKRPTIGISKYTENQLSGLIDDDAVRRIRAGGGGVLRFDWPAFGK